MLEIEMLREELHRAVDAILDGLGSGQPPTGNGANGLRVTSEGDGGEWRYRWPRTVETFSSYRDYRVAGDEGEADVRVARTTRQAFSRPRGRAIVFGRTRSENFYPWIEFVETDKPDAYSALMLDRYRPRRVIREGEPLLPRFQGKDVQRTDELFGSVANGPTLRLVVRADDEDAMIVYAYWVATIKKRL